MQTQGYDVVVVGGGAAGLGGAMALGRSRRSVLVVDAGDPRNAPAAGVHNYLGHEGTPPADLLAIGRAEVAAYGVEVTTGEVVSAKPLHDAADGFRFVVRTADGREVRARRLLVTTGLRDELPNVPGLRERWGHDVLHCPYCHGYEVRDQPIGVLATGPFAAHQTLMFRQLSADVVLFTHVTSGPTPTEREQLAALDVRVVDGEVVAVESDAGGMTGVRLASGDVVPRAALVVSPRFVARSAVLESLGVRADPQEMMGQVFGTAVAVDATGATSLAGVWAAGNVTQPQAQVMGSAAAGVLAGAAINGDLITEDVATAVASHRAQAGVSA